MAYCDQIIAGKIRAGRLAIAAVQRFLDDLDHAEERGYFLDRAEALRRIEFVGHLRHTKGEHVGMPFALQPWQKFIWWNLFGWKSRETGFRRFREAMLSMGRGNGKSPMGAALVNSLMCQDGEARAEIKLAATEKPQARIVFEECIAQLQSVPDLAELCEFWKQSIVFSPLQSTIVPLGGEGKTKDGFNLHAFTADEIHAWTEEHDELWSKLNTAMSKRRQPLAIVITTAGNDRSKLWIRFHKFSSQVAQQIVRGDSHFSFICEIDDEDLETCLDDQELWIKANPNLGVSVKPGSLADLAAKARLDPCDRTDFLRYHMNKRVRAAEKVISAAIWLKGAGPLPELLGRPAGFGLDLGWTNDLASLYGCWPLPDRRFALKGWNWIPANGKRDLRAHPWETWIREGYLTATIGTATDPDAIYSRIAQVGRDYQVLFINYDPNNAKAPGLHILNNLGLPAVAFPQQSANYNEPCREFLTALAEGRILHGNDPVLSWAADNLVLRTNAAGLVMPAKDLADEKIDPMVAALMAFAGCLFSDASAHNGPRIAFL